MVVNRIQTLQIQQRGFITALYGMDDDSFVLPDLHIYNFEQALHLYLKKEGFKTIVFYSSTDGFYAYEKACLLRFFTNNNQSQTDKHTTGQLFDPAKSKRPIAGRSLIQKNTSKQLVQKEEESIVYCSNFSRGYYTRKNSMAYDAIIHKLLTVLDSQRDIAIILNVSMSETEFTNTQARQLEERFRRIIDNYRFSPIQNKLLINYHIHSEKNEFTHAFRSIYRSIFTTPFFQDLFMKENNGNEIPSEQVFYIASPDADEIRNYIHRLRLLDKQPVDHLRLSTICEQLATRELSINQLVELFRTLPAITYDLLKEKRYVFDQQIQIDQQRMREILAEVKGQTDMIELITQDIYQWAKQEKREKPLSFFCVGTSGVGKTFTTECVNKALQANGFEYVRFNMTEFSQEHEGAKLIGSPPGYVGSTTRPKLFEYLRKHKRLIICFDEIEKAHDTVITMLMNLLDAGTLSWNNEEGDFRDCLLFFTSNLMQEEVVRVKKEQLSHQTLPAAEVVRTTQFQNRIRDVFKNPSHSKSLRPEFCGRIDRYLVYNTLSAEDIVDISIATIRKEIRKQHRTDETINPSSLFTWAKAYARSMYGARGLKKEIKEALERNPQLLISEGREEPDVYSKSEALALYDKYWNNPKIQIDTDYLANRLRFVKGQSEIIDVLIHDIKSWSYIPIHQKPLNFFSVGTSGVGKTFTAEILADALKTEGYRSVIFSMNEYARESDMAKLIGSAPGYAGASERPELFRQIADCQRLVICFDEIEKAHPQIMRTLMQLLDKGKLSWNGEVGNFRDCIILFTSNIEQQKMVEAKNSVLKKYADPKTALRSSELKQRIVTILCEAKNFQIPVEIWGRINRFLIYNPLHAKEVMEIAIQETTSIVQKIFRKELRAVSPAFLASLAQKYSGSPLGIRPLKEEVREIVTDSAEAIMQIQNPLCQLVQEAEGYRIMPLETEERSNWTPILQEAIHQYHQSQFQIHSFDKDALRDRLAEVYSQEDKASLLAAKIASWFMRPIKQAPLTLFLAGTSGTGKTYTSKIIASFLAEYGYEFTDINMSEYGNEGDVWKLIGSATGYMGSDQKSLLRQAYDRSSKQVILFDEIEKSHPKILDTIMRLMERGLITLNEMVCDFSQSILIFTSNIVMDQLVRRKQELSNTGVFCDNPVFQQEMKRIMGTAGFRPDILGRINTVAIYNPLDEESLQKVAISEIRKLGKLYNLQINQIEHTFIRQIAHLFNQNNEGARPVANYCEMELGELFALSPIRSGLLDIVKSGHSFQIQPSVCDQLIDIQELYHHIQNETNN